MNTKKTIKRMPALLLSVAFILCFMAVGISAHRTSGPTFDGTTQGSLTINKTDGAGSAINDNQLEYTIYKVASIAQTNTGGVVSVKYILGNGIVVDTGSGTVTGDGSTVTVPSGVKAADFETTTLPTGTAISNTLGTGTIAFNNLDLGLYLVMETETPAGVSRSNDFLVSIPMSVTVGGNQVWDYDPIATPKNTVIDGTVSKTIISSADVIADPDASPGTNTWTASLGATIPYSITATLPTTFIVTPYTTYKLTDIPATGLVIDKTSITVKVGTDTLVDGTDYDLTDSGDGFSIEFITDVPTDTTPGTQSSKLTNSADVIITYNATLSPTATGSSFVNTVKIDSAYNTDNIPETPPTITPDPTDPPPTVNTYNYALQKVDGDNGNAFLAGATFAIMNSSDEYLTWTVADGWGIATDLSDADLYTYTSTVGENAIVPFKGLAGGTYKIVETKAPSGYSLLTDPIVVTIGLNSSTDMNTGAGYSIQVVNTLANSFILPGTGGMGIYLYIIGGAALIGAAIFLFARNRRRKNAA